MFALYDCNALFRHRLQYFRHRLAWQCRKKPRQPCRPSLTSAGEQLEKRWTLDASTIIQTSQAQMQKLVDNSQALIKNAAAATPVSFNDALKIPDVIGTQYANRLTLEDISRIAQFGFKSIRISIDPQTADLARYNSLIHAMWTSRITPILVLVSPSQMNQAEVRDRVINATMLLAARYADGAILWDAWNEPTSAVFWRGTAAPITFANFAARLVAEIKSAAPLHKIILPSIQRVDKAGKAFLTAVFDARPELLQQIDYIAVHTYGPASGAGPYDPESKIKALVDLRTELLKKYKQIPELVISEFGWHTRGGGSISPTTQGHYAPRLILNAIANHIPLTVYYQWRDEPKEIGRTEPGLQSIAYQPRPGYFGLKKLIDNLRDYAFVKSLSSSETKVLLFRNKAGDEKIAAWATCSSSRSIKITTLNHSLISITNINQSPRYMEVPKEKRISDGWAK